jgi:phospholipase/carboxylesterase
MAVLDGIEREIGGVPDLSIWLHGLGADASDFVPVIGELALSGSVRFVFPNAPVRAVTINGGIPMRAWYDVLGFGADVPVDEAGLEASVEVVTALVEREVERGIARDRIVLAGFSQGGAVVLHSGLGMREMIGGIIGLSTYLPAAAKLAAKPARTDVPVMLAHGTNDSVLPLALGENSAAYLRRLGVEVDWSTYPMAHEVCIEEIDRISQWLGRFESP